MIYAIGSIMITLYTVRSDATSFGKRYIGTHHNTAGPSLYTALRYPMR